jgi:BirA family biotin operon repressor/biotin-[acetyl-CoA-carboxylase] ligase
MNSDSIKMLALHRKGHEFGHAIYLSEKIGSTQELAKLMLAKGIKSQHGTIVIARQQLNGRGRFGRNWISPTGGLWMSVIMTQGLTIKRAPIIQFLVAISVGETIAEMTRIECTYKWPNDLLVHGKKICGILVDVELQGNIVKNVVAGIGLNVNFPAAHLYRSKSFRLHSEVTTLRDELGYDVPLLDIIKLILEKLESYNKLLKNGRIKAIMDTWRLRSEKFDRMITIKEGNTVIQARALGVDDRGVLKVELPDKTVKEIILGVLYFTCDKPVSTLG